MSRRARLLALLAVLALLAGCGLPLSGGVKSVGSVPETDSGTDPISVLPPGPQKGAAPEDIVRGFLVAQSSPRNDHGVARSFLVPELQRTWDDEAGVVVYDPATLSVGATSVEGGAAVQVSFSTVGRVAADGSATVQAGRMQSLTYVLRQDAAGQWRLADVPAGLTLSPSDRDRSYAATSVMYLAVGSGDPHLVPDRVLISVDGERARRLVDRVVAGPSAGLGSSGRTAVPAGTTVRAVSTNAAGEVAVDLSAGVGDLPLASRDALAAQLVWTLKTGLGDSFSRLRLLSGGQPVVLDSGTSPVPRAAYAGFDPEGNGRSPVGLALVAGVIVALQDEDGTAGRPDPSSTGSVTSTPVTDAVADVRSGRVALLAGSGAAQVLQVTTAGGPPITLLAGPGLLSPTWGDATHGVWFVRTGPSGGILTVRPGAPPVAVRATGLPVLGPDAVLRVSRDGARVAVVSEGVLRLGRVAVSDDGALEVVDLRMLVAAGVRDVAWVDGTELAVLVADDQPPLLPLLRLSVDGTARPATGLLNGAESLTVAVTASGDAPLLVETQLAGVSTTYRGTAGAGFQVEATGASRPRYPD
jgi:hypothetical protein